MASHEAPPNRTRGGGGHAACHPATAAYEAMKGGLTGIGCVTKTAPNENVIDSTGMPFRAPSLLTDQVAKTCTELTVRARRRSNDAHAHGPFPF